MAYPTRKHNLGTFLPSDSFKISTPSVTVTIASDMLPSMTPGLPKRAVPTPGDNMQTDNFKFGYTSHAPPVPNYLGKAPISSPSYSSPYTPGPYVVNVPRIYVLYAPFLFLMLFFLNSTRHSNIHTSVLSMSLRDLNGSGTPQPLTKRLDAALIKTMYTGRPNAYLHPETSALQEASAFKMENGSTTPPNYCESKSPKELHRLSADRVRFGGSLSASGEAYFPMPHSTDGLPSVLHRARDGSETLSHTTHASINTYPSRRQTVGDSSPARIQPFPLGNYQSVDNLLSRYSQSDAPEARMYRGRSFMDEDLSRQENEDSPIPAHATLDWKADNLVNDTTDGMLSRFKHEGGIPIYSPSRFKVSGEGMPRPTTSARPQPIHDEQSFLCERNGSISENLPQSMSGPLPCSYDSRNDNYIPQEIESNYSPSCRSPRQLQVEAGLETGSVVPVSSPNPINAVVVRTGATPHYTKKPLTNGSPRSNCSSPRTRCAEKDDQNFSQDKDHQFSSIRTKPSGKQIITSTFPQNSDRSNIIERDNSNYDEYIDANSDSSYSSNYKRRAVGENEWSVTFPHEPDYKYPVNDLEALESSRFYETQMELYVGFIGIQAVFIYANFVFGNYAGGVLSLFGLIAASYSHIDRRCSSYILSAAVYTISVIVLSIAVTAGIDGFSLYKTEGTLKTIAIGSLPLGIIFILHNISLAYQHGYRNGMSVIEDNRAATALHSNVPSSTVRSNLKNNAVIHRKEKNNLSQQNRMLRNEDG